MDGGVMVVTMAVKQRCLTSCCFHFLPVVDLSDNFNAFPTSEVNPSYSKSSFPGVCEVVVTTKTRTIAGMCYITSLHKCLIKILIKIFSMEFF